MLLINTIMLDCTESQGKSKTSAYVTIYSSMIAIFVMIALCSLVKANFDQGRLHTVNGRLSSDLRNFVWKKFPLNWTRPGTSLIYNFGKDFAKKLLPKVHK